MKLEALAIETVREVQLGTSQIKKAFHIDYHAHTFVLKLLVHRAGFVIKIKLVAQARAATTGHRGAEPVSAVKLSIVYQVLNFSFGFIRNGNHISS